MQNYNAKLSDFGLAKDGPVGDKSHVSTRVMGTHGYAAPEYLATGIVAACALSCLFHTHFMGNCGYAIFFPYRMHVMIT